MMLLGPGLDSADSLVVAAGDMQVPYKQVALPLNATLDGYCT